MVLTDQKPTRRPRKGEWSEGLPGSTKSVGYVERSVENLRGPGGSWEETGRPLQAQEGEPKASRESDQPIVLGDGRAVHVQI